jgi:MoaA/NifB/PqqE/SkfB family radical SAM enzyme
MTDGPKKLDIYVTSKCNMSCDFCRRQKGVVNMDAEDFTAELANHVLNMYPTIQGACVAGFGEPLMSPGLPELLETLLARKVYVGLITNGTLINDRASEIKWSRLGYVNVSVNSAFPPDAVTDGISALRASGANVSVSFVVDAMRWRHILSYLGLASRLGVKDVSIVNLLPHHDTTDVQQNNMFWEQVIKMSNAEYALALPTFKAEAAKLGLRVNHWPVLMSRRYCQWLCRSPWENIGVDGSGNMSVCNRVLAPQPGRNVFMDTWEVVAAELRSGITGQTSEMCKMCFGSCL